MSKPQRVDFTGEEVYSICLYFLSFVLDTWLQTEVNKTFNDKGIFLNAANKHHLLGYRLCEIGTITSFNERNKCQWHWSE